MKAINLRVVLVIVILTFAYCTKPKYKVEHLTDDNGFKYITVADDPIKARIYTLENGLKVYLTVNKDKPCIQTLIAINAGATYDPKETTGLAHYMEHLMFKGSHKIGTSNWGKEKMMLDEISDLYEQHRNTDDANAKKKIYAKIDSVSNIAAQYVVPNEYIKLTQSIGAKAVNAYTAYERTVYENNIPSNELEKWILLERERFDALVLRLFHTELETVYEEFNMTQDNDNRKAYTALMQALYQKHPYGTQTVIGDAFQLKNPSMVNIYNFFNTYYVPNNMAICLSGDLNCEETIMLIDKYWRDLKPNHNLERPKFEKEDPISEPVIRNIYGSDAEFMYLAYRLDGAGSKDETYCKIIDMLLSNYQAGLMDINLKQQQKVLDAYAYTSMKRDYGMFVMYGTPREGQELEEVKSLLLEQLDKIKKGEFENWLMEAVINDLKLSQIKNYEDNNKRARAFVDAFIFNQKWVPVVREIESYSKITKQQIINYANKKFKNNYVVINKRLGEPKDIVHLDKPRITPVTLNRTAESEFFKEYAQKTSPQVEPVFVDFKEAIQTEEIKSGVELNYIENHSNELFNLYYIIEAGSKHNKKIALALNYLPYLGTSKYSAEELQKEFYKIGVSMNVSSGKDKSYISISGLNDSFEKGVELLEHVLAKAKADKEVYQNYVNGILTKRNNAKLSKDNILWTAMYAYAKYGPQNPVTNIIPEDELKAINPNKLTQLVSEICTYPHQVFYYGPQEIEEVNNQLIELHPIPETLVQVPEATEYNELEMAEPQVYFVDYNMVQNEMLLLARDVKFDKNILPVARFYNEYYGGGMSSIVFQEIREAKALAYTVFASYSTPQKADESHYTYAYFGTQTDKMEEALTTLLQLMNEMPQAERQFESSKESIIKQLRSERIIKQNIFFTALNNKELGIDYDYRKEIYEQAQKMNLEDVNKFFNQHIKGKSYNILVLGDKSITNMKALEKHGSVQELTLEELFSY